MERVIPFVLCTALILLAGMTMASNSFAILDTSTHEFAATYERNNQIWKTSIEPLSTALQPIGRRDLEISLTNNGRTRIADFSKWDVIVQYFDSQDNYHIEWLPYVEGPPDLNEWSVKGIYLNADNAIPELLEPGILNPDEEIIVEIKLSQEVHAYKYNLAIISTAGGISSWSHFRGFPLYLHNNPTPPTANTTAQDTLPMSITETTATTLYNYDSNYSSDPGRSIERSGGSVNESNLARYQIWRVGPLPESVGDSLEFDTDKGQVPDIINVSGDVYAIAYQADHDYGVLKTVEILSSGNITDAVIDTLEFDTDKGQVPDIINVSGDIYAIVYQGDGDDGMLVTVEILSSGNITNAVIDTLEFDTDKGQVPDIINVSGDIYAIVYLGDGDDGMLVTVEILSSGNITNAVIDTLEFDTDKGQVPDIINVSGDIYAIAYQGDGDDGMLVTVEIDPNGAITDTVIDTLEFDTDKGQVPDIINVSGDIYAIAYQADHDYGVLKTVEILSSGNITDAVIDTLEFDGVQGMLPIITSVSGDVYTIAYQADHDYGVLKTVEILSSGNITDSVIDTLDFDGVRGMVPVITNVSGNIFAIAYQGDGDDGILQTVMILSDGTIGNVFRINGNVTLTLWGAIEDFQQSERGVVIAYLRDYDGSDYTEIANATVDAPDWQSGSDSWVEAAITFIGVSYTIQGGHYLDVKVLVDNDSGANMWFAYDTTDYQSCLWFP